jgi:hypothetical protein
VIFKSHNKVVFFFCLLISLSNNTIIGQTTSSDTLKKVVADTLSNEEFGNELEDDVTYIAEDSLVALPQQGKVFLYGKSKVKYGSMNMEAEVIEIDYKKSTVIAYGKRDSLGKIIGSPVFKDGSETMEAEKIMYNLKSKRGKIFNALTKQGELLMKGSEIKKDSTDIIYFKDMKCLPCQEADARTAFRASKAKVIPNDKIVTGPMYLEVGGIPTPLGLPFGYFPNTKSKHNGILFPKLGNSTTLGFNLRDGGYYWGINDRTDMVIRGDIYGNGSWGVNTTNNYNVLYRSRGQVYVGYNRFNVGDRDVPKEFSVQESNTIRWMHTQDNRNNPTMQFNANVNFVTNQTYNRFNAENTQQFLTNTFQSNINFSKMFKSSSLSLNATHDQNAISKVMNITLPSLTYNVNRFFPFKRENAIKQNVFDKIGVSYSMLAKNQLSGNEQTIFKGSLKDSIRYGVQHSLPISTNFNILKYITATPALNLSSVMYPSSIRKEFYTEAATNDVERNDSTITRDTIYQRIRNKRVKSPVVGYDASFSTAFNTKLYFDYQFFKGNIKQIRHVLIPTITYNYRPDFGEEQYGFWKKVQRDTLGNTTNYSIFEREIFTGPNMGKTNGLGISLYNTVDAKLKQKTDTGVTYKKVAVLQNFGLVTNYNFARDSFKMSDISIGGQTVLFKNITLNANSVFSPYQYNQASKRTVDQFYYKSGRGLARFINANFALTTALSSDMVEAAKKLKEPPKTASGIEKGMEDDLGIGTKVSWLVRLNYNLSLNNPDDRKTQPTHNIGITADLKPTPYWKIGVSSGYDFTNLKPSTTNFTIYRDLKCWEAHITWVPFGVWKSYSIGLNLKTAMLSSLKLEWPRTPAVQ